MSTVCGRLGSMIDHFGINCSDLPAAAAFYNKVLGTLGYRRVLDVGVAIGYGADAPDFWIGAQPPDAPPVPTARSTWASRPGTPTPSGRSSLLPPSCAPRSSTSRVSGRNSRALLRGVRPRPGRQQRGGGLPHRPAGVGAGFPRSTGETADLTGRTSACQARSDSGSGSGRSVLHRFGSHPGSAHRGPGMRPA